MGLDSAIRWIGALIDAFGVAVIALGILWASGRILWDALRRKSPANAYHRYRQGVGHSILLGLEMLVAGDIIRTVAVRPTFSNVGVLVIIVLVRTFLSWTLEVELSGRFPWQRRNRGEDP
jgi:uncharacterized membrane protein